MFPLSGRLKGFGRTLLGLLPLTDYQKTRLWATSLPRPAGRVKDWPYYRSVELAVRSFATHEGYTVAFPGAGDPASTFSMLEFGVANGNSLQVLLHFRDVWLRRLRLKNKVTVVGFDTFGGIPAPRDGDVGLPWKEGDFHRSDVASLQTHLEGRFSGFRLVKGEFKDSLKNCDEFLRSNPPVFVSIDCDYYSSTMDVFEFLLPEIAPHGCLFYFDDVSINFWSDKTGELRAISEVNAGKFGSHISFVEYPLWIETGEMRHYKQVYRLFNLEKAEQQRQSSPPRAVKQAPRHSRVTPL